MDRSTQNMKHRLRFFFGVLAVAMALIDVAPPLAQIAVASVAIITGAIGLGVINRARKGEKTLMLGLEAVLFVLAIVFAFGQLTAIR